MIPWQLRLVFEDYAPDGLGRFHEERVVDTVDKVDQPILLDVVVLVPGHLESRKVTGVK